MSHRTYYPPALMDVEAAAEYISVSPRKLADIQARGDLIPKKLDGKKGYLREDLEEYARKLPDWEAKK